MMGQLQIRVDNVSAYVEASSEMCTNFRESVEWLRAYLTWESVSYPGGKKVKLKKSLYEAWSKSFPAGLVPAVKKAGVRDGVSVQVRVPESRVQFDPSIDTSWLRDYQKNALSAAVEKRRGVLWLPTGSGKTEIATALMKVTPSCRWLFLVHRAQLVKQSADRFQQRTGEEAGMLGGGHDSVKRVTFATFQTLSNAYKPQNQDNPKYQRVRKLIAAAGGIIVDECHVLPARTFLELTKKAQKAEFRIGLSATPFSRGDSGSLHLVGALGPTIFRLKVEELADRNAIIKPTIKFVEVHQPIPTPAVNPRRAWKHVYRDGIEHSQVRNAKIVQMVKGAEVPSLVFVTGLDHMEILVEQFSNAGIPCAGIYGATPQDERESIIELLKKGDLEVLVATVVLQEGVDIPNLRSVIVASGGKSTIAAIQRAGRAMRTSDGKNRAIIIDMWDTGNKILERHAKKRKRAYEKEGFNVETIEG